MLTFIFSSNQASNSCPSFLHFADFRPTMCNWHPATCSGSCLVAPRNRKFFLPGYTLNFAGFCCHSRDVRNSDHRSTACSGPNSPGPFCHLQCKCPRNRRAFSAPQGDSSSSPSRYSQLRRAAAVRENKF